jgi:hypothetical protein
MNDKKSGFMGFKDKLMSKISEVVDGKKDNADIDPDDILANRVRDIELKLSEVQSAHKEQEQRVGELNKLISQLNGDIHAMREESSEIEDEDEDEDEDTEDDSQDVSDVEDPEDKDKDKDKDKDS